MQKRFNMRVIKLLLLLTFFALEIGSLFNEKTFNHLTFSMYWDDECPGNRKYCWKING